MYYYLLRTTEIWLFLHVCLFNIGLVMPYFASFLRVYVLLNVRFALTFMYNNCRNTFNV